MTGKYLLITAILSLTVCCHVVMGHGAGENKIKPSELDLQRGLVGYWKFDDHNCTIATDYSGYENHGRIYGAKLCEGKICHGLQFDGKDDYVKIQYSSSLDLSNQFSVSLWIKVEEVSNGCLVSKGVHCSNPRAWTFYVSTELIPPCPSILFEVYAGKDDTCKSIYSKKTAKFPSDISAVFWHHIVMTCDDRIIKHYENGRFIGSDTLEQSICSNREGIIIGHNQCLNEHDPIFSFEGILDEIRLYNRVLSREEIEAIYYADEYNNGYVIEDSIQPSKPVVYVSANFPNRVDLKWKAATDDIAVKGYRVFRDGKPVADVTHSGEIIQGYSDVYGIAPSGNYTYSISAYDFGENSNLSYPVNVTTPSCIMLPVFPGAQGFGSGTPAGRGGKVYKVKNLLDYDTGAGDPSIKGSLREGIDIHNRNNQATVIVFEVSGTIALKKELRITSPLITIAGHTAPAPGVTLKGAGLRVSTHDVLVQHLRIRVGDDPSGPDPESRDGVGITAEPDGSLEIYNIVIDHCSISWAVDEIVEFWYPGVHDVTISNCIISEGLHNSIHPKGAHSKGVLVGRHAHNISLLRNLFAHNDDRNPAVQGLTATLIVNNLVYNPGYYGISILDSERDGPLNSTIMGNVVIPTAQTGCAHSALVIYDSVDDRSHIYLWDNLCESKRDGDPWSCALNFKGAAIKSLTPPCWISPLTVMPSESITAWILNHAGARPINRDTVDMRIISDVKNNTGNIIDSQDEVGGWPSLPENVQPLQIPANPGGDEDKDGYTNLEEWLHGYLMRAEYRKSNQKLLQPFENTGE